MKPRPPTIRSYELKKYAAQEPIGAVVRIFD
jgi:hypothetical protein